MTRTAIDTTELARLHVAHVTHLERIYGEVLARTGYDAVVLHSGSLKLRSQFDDQYWPLRVVPHFQHWLPLAHPDCALVITQGRRACLYWPTAVSFWENPPVPEWDGWRAAIEVVEVGGPRDIKDHLPTFAPSTGRRAIIGEGHVALDWGFAAEEMNPPDLVRELDLLRTRKTDYEIFCIAEANRRAALGHQKVAAAFRSGERSELLLHLAYLAATSQDDPETPYKNIVALGAHAATLHHIDYRRRPAPARSLLLDAGATFLGYNSDITRTHAAPGSGAAETAFAHLLAGMERLQQALCAHVAVGRPYEELHEESHRHVAELLREVGVVRMGTAEMDERGVTRTFFPHGLGHSLGLQTHDVGCAQIQPKPRNPFLRNTSTIVPGQVFTIEPGLYFIPGLLDELRQKPEGSAVDWRLVGELRELGGIRIEDDVLVTGDQAAPVRNLTREVLPS